MSREAIESFVDEIRDVLPKMRRAFAIMHACLDERDARLEAHRLAHSIKGTAALVGVETLSQIADHEEQLIERLIDGRLTMDDQLRDTLERLADIVESFADRLLAGTVPEERLLAEAIELCRRHNPAIGDALGAGLSTPPDTPTEGLSNDAPAAEEPIVQTCGPTSGGVERPAPIASDSSEDEVPAQPPVVELETSESDSAGAEPLHDAPSQDAPSEPMVVSGLMELSAWDVFHIEATRTLRELVERLDTYRGDSTRWDVLADVRRRVNALYQAATTVGLADFADLTVHAERLLQRVLDRNVPPSEQIADCLQGCVDALEERLERPLDESLLQLLHERIEQLCELEPCETTSAHEELPPDDAPSAVVAETTGEDSHAPSGHEELEIAGEADPSLAIRAGVEAAARFPTSPESIELDDRTELSEEMLEVFHEEAEDHLRLIYSAFAELEKNPGRMSAVQDVRRSAHTIKGAAGSVGLRLVSKLSHRMEDLLDRLFSSQQPVSTSTLALLYDTTDALQDLVHGNYAAEGMQVTVAQLYDSYEALLSGGDSGREPKDVSPSVESEVNSATDAQPSLQTPLSLSQGFNGYCATPTERSSSAEAVEPPAQGRVRDTNDECFMHSENIGPTSVDPTPANELVVDEFLPMLAAWNRLAEPVAVPPPQSAESLASNDEHKRQGESLRVPLARLESLMREVGELIINRSAFEQRMADFARCVEDLQRAVTRMKSVAHDLDAKYGVGALGGRRALWGDGESLLSGGRRFGGSTSDEFDALEFDRYTEFHLLSRSLSESTADLGTVGNELRNLMGDFDQLLNRQGRLSRDTQDRLMRIRMVPLATLASKLYRTVRVVAGQQHKDVEFLIQGGDTELDKAVLEELADPLMHLLRNAVDHGLESADVRRTANKSERATIRLQAFAQGTQVVIRVEDDGAGLNFEAIRETAVRHGLVTADDAAKRTEDELAALIFLPGFSTARKVSEVSGRGVGMDIVRDKVQLLKGTISVASLAGQGTTFTIRLPMTMAVTRALLVHASHETFAIPIQSVVQILRLERKQIEQLGPSPMIRLGEEALPLVYLSDRLRLRAPADKTSATLPVLVLAAGTQKVAIAVEKILAGRDIVVKTLGSHLRKVKGLIGATLMGDGSVVPILDAADLVGQSGMIVRPQPVVPAPHRPVHHDEAPLLMVVDDSVSVRRVMTNLLKNAGWQVLDAKDGLDALEKLQQAERQPDLFLLDIEMPRMDGYELLTSLRSHTEHRETPIVIVTSRAGDKHRQKAMQLGATDYAIKPYQEDELLSLLRRLLVAQREAVLV